jgi:predicted DNA-binding protein with PD1-like motif
VKSKIVEDADVVTYIVVSDPGDEAVSTLEDFARAERLEASQVTAVGGFERATLGWSTGGRRSTSGSWSASSPRCCR